MPEIRQIAKFWWDGAGKTVVGEVEIFERIPAFRALGATRRLFLEAVNQSGDSEWGAAQSNALPFPDRESVAPVEFGGRQLDGIFIHSSV